MTKAVIVFFHYFPPKFIFSHYEIAKVYELSSK